MAIREPNWKTSPTYEGDAVIIPFPTARRVQRENDATAVLAQRMFEEAYRQPLADDVARRIAEAVSAALQ